LLPPLLLLLLHAALGADAVVIAARIDIGLFMKHPDRAPGRPFGARGSRRQPTAAA